MNSTEIPALALHGLSVAYGPVRALQDVSVELAPGLIHAVVGQNGAGKTTFARAAAGIVRPTNGHIEILGKSVRPGDVSEARAAGMEIVHQSFALPPSFTIAEAMEFGAPGPAGVHSLKGLRQRWSAHLEDLDINVSSDRRIRDLPIETQQAIEIARALVANARVLILDEPTAVLSPSGALALFERVRGLKERGVTVILILHKIREVLKIADTITVLRGGELIAGAEPRDKITAVKMTELIIGEAHVSTAILGAKSSTDNAPDTEPDVALDSPPSTTVMHLQDITTQRGQDGSALEIDKLSVHEGEIVGVAGVEGNGQYALIQALAGLTAFNSGSFTLAGADATTERLTRRRARGLRIIPFERNTEGLSLSSAVWENWITGSLLQGRLFALINPARIREKCNSALKAWSVHYQSAWQRAGSLSGGNAQKVILSREIDEDAKMIVAAQPTRGLDIGATDFVWNALRSARKNGAGILLISSDLDELFDISDRVVVMLSGKIVGEFHAPYNLNAVGAAMTGANGDGATL